MKKTKLLLYITIIIAIILLPSCSANEGLQDVTSNNLNDLYSIDGYIFFGRPTSISSEDFLPYLKEFINKHEIKDVYYFNIDNFVKIDDNSEEFINYLNHYNISEVPTVIKLSNGKEIDRLTVHLNSKEFIDSGLDVKEVINEFFTKK